MSAAPWYIAGGNNAPSLKHQRNWRDSLNRNKTIESTSSAIQGKWYDRGATVFKAKTFRKGACTK